MKQTMTNKEALDRIIDMTMQEIFPTDGAEILNVARQALEKQIHGEWIPITSRPITEEERKEYGWDEDITHIFDCPLPDDGDEILISRNHGKWVSLTVFCNCGWGVGDEDGNDWLYEVDAWMPLPKGYVKDGE